MFLFHVYSHDKLIDINWLLFFVSQGYNRTVQCLAAFCEGNILLKVSLIFCLSILASCSSYEQFKNLSKDFEMPGKVFRSDFNETWQAVLVVMRDTDLESKNQEAGILKSRWIDNTLELNFSDSFGGADSVKSAKYKIIINVIKGYRGIREVTKVSVYKRQLVERDFLQGWREVVTDQIQENTILYRIERVLAIEKQLKKIEDLRAQEAEEEI